MNWRSVCAEYEPDAGRAQRQPGQILPAEPVQPQVLTRNLSHVPFPDAALMDLHQGGVPLRSGPFQFPMQA